MISYIFNNNHRIDKNFLLNFFKSNFDLHENKNSLGSIILTNTDMFIDIDTKYISILLYNESINIKPIKKHLLEKHHAKERNEVYRTI